MSYRSIGKKCKINNTLVSRIFKIFCKGSDKSLVSQSERKAKLQRYEILCMKRISNKNPFLRGRKVRYEYILNNKISMARTNRVFTDEVQMELES